MGYTPFNWCERCGAAAQGIGEAIPKHTVAPWRQHFGGSPRRLNRPCRRNVLAVKNAPPPSSDGKNGYFTLPQGKGKMDLEATI